MFKVSYYNDMCEDNILFFWEEEVAAAKVKQLEENMCVAVYSEAHDERTIVEIGEKIGMKLGDANDIFTFVRRLMERLEGKKEYVKEMQFLVAYWNKQL